MQKSTIKLKMETFSNKKICGEEITRNRFYIFPPNELKFRYSQFTFGTINGHVVLGEHILN